MATIGLLRALNRHALVVEGLAAADLRGELPTERYRLAVLDLGGFSCVDPAAAAEVDALRVVLPDTPLVLISDHDEADEIRRAIAAGVQGYLPTSLRPEVAVGALELVLAGGEYFPKIMPASPAPSPPAGPAGGSAMHDVPWPPPRSWTSREKDVADRLCRGESNKVIARTLGLQESTVKIYVRRIREKLGAANRTQAALLLSLPNPVAMGDDHLIPGASPPESRIELQAKGVSSDDGH